MPPQTDAHGRPLPRYITRELDDNFILHHAGLLQQWCDVHNDISGSQRSALTMLIDCAERLIARDDAGEVKP